MTRQIIVRLLLLTCAFASLAIRVFAQAEGAIIGTVLAEADRSAVVGAELRLKGILAPLNLTATSDAVGGFIFQRLVPGDYELVATQAGFAEQRLRLTLKPREVQNVSLRLALRAVVQEVHVAATAEAVAPTHSPSSTLLQKDAVENLPLGQRTNLTDVIVMAAPGMIRGHDDFVHVRGSEIALNTFINGVSFWENPHSVFSAGVSPDVIQSVNVMTGGFPAEYGNRFGGVLDVVTKSGFIMDNHGSVTAGIGTALRHNAQMEYGTRAGNVAFYVFGAGFSSARFLSPPDPRSIHNTGRGARTFAQLDVNVDAANSLKVVLMGDGTNFQIPKSALDAEARPNAEAFQRNRAQAAILTWDRVLSSRSLLHTSLYQRWSRSLLLPAIEQRTAHARTERTLDTVGIKSDWSRSSGRHAFKSGLDFVLLRSKESLFYDGAGYIRLTHDFHLPHPHFTGTMSLADRKTGGQASLYVQDKVRVTDSLTADIGLRFDRHSLVISQSHFSPRLNLAYRIAQSGTVLHASYNHFFVPPPIENILIGSAGLTRFIREIGRGLPPIQPIVENQFEVGVNQPLHRRLNLGVTGYYRISNNPVHTIVFPDSRIYAYANFDKGKAYGMEFKAQLPALGRRGVSAYLNYALGRVYLHNPVTAGFVTDDHHVVDTARFLAPMDQTHTLNSGITYRHSRSGLWAGMMFEYGSGTPLGHGHAHEGDATVVSPERAPEHFTQNLSAGIDLLRDRERGRLTLQFNVENLTDNVHKVAQESVFSPAQYSIPRLFSAAIKVHF